jgi:hypothetical protein
MSSKIKKVLIISSFQSKILSRCLDVYRINMSIRVYKMNMHYHGFYMSMAVLWTRDGFGGRETAFPSLFLITHPRSVIIGLLVPISLMGVVKSGLVFAILGFREKVTLGSLRFSLGPVCFLFCILVLFSLDEAARSR